MTDKARILFVDDEKRVLNAMRGLFRRDFELFLTTEGADAIRIATENEIDVIVADQRMPGMTGIEVLGKVKELAPRTVRILLTGYADPSAIEGSINIGEVFRFLSKPCPPQMLREALDLAITASRTSPVETSETRPAEPPAPSQRAAEPEAPQVEKPQAEIADADPTDPALPALDETAIQKGGGQRPEHWQSVTNVVMSEDRVEESHETTASTPAANGARDVGVVVFTVESEFASTAIRAVSTQRDTILATTLVKVAKAIQEKSAGVLVTDFTSNNSTLQKMIGALKKHMPELVTIVVSGNRDSDDMVNLINYGQIFRYVLKPVEPEQLRNDINAAAIRHDYLRNNPEALIRHRVDDSLDTTSESSMIDRILGKIRQRPELRSDPTDTIN